MSYRKVIVTGDVFEVYEMERMPKRPQYDRDKDDFMAQVLDTKMMALNPETRAKAIADGRQMLREGFKEKEDRKEERRKQTLRNSRDKLKRISRNNFGPKDLFVTLTYAENFADIDLADIHFRDFIEELNEEFNHKHKYIAVREFQERGAIHFHMLIDLNITWDRNDHETREKYERQVHELFWNHGWVDLKRLDFREEGNHKKVFNETGENDNVGAYISKYFETDDSRLNGHKIYLTSKGLEREMTYYGEEANKIIEFYNLKQQKKVFTNSYESEYHGNINYDEYNLKRR